MRALAQACIVEWGKEGGSVGFQVENENIRRQSNVTGTIGKLSFHLKISSA